MSAFGRLVGTFKRRRGKKRVRNPRALAAYIGRRKYGAKRFEQKAEAGRRRAARRRTK